MTADGDNELKSKVELLIKKQSAKDKAYKIPKQEISFEEARDGYRFYTNLLLVSMIVSFIVLMLSYGSYFFKERAHSFATSSSGVVTEIKPYKIQ